MVVPLVGIIMDPEYLDKIRGLIPLIENTSNKEIILFFLLLVCVIFILKILFIYFIFI